MGCAACQSFDDAERAAIEGRDLLKLPEHTLDGCTCESESTIALTLLRPERLALSPQRGTSVEVTWGGLLRWLSRPVEAADKAAAGGFVLAKLTGGIRRGEHVETVSAIALDYDGGQISVMTAHEKLSPCKHVVYSTASSTPEAPRWRAILVVSRPMLASEYAVLWSSVTRSLRRHFALDQTTKDPCRLWYAPTVAPGSTYELLHFDGEALDVDGLLAEDSQQPEKRSSLPPVERYKIARQDAYLQAALDSECSAVEGAPDGTRNSTLNKSAHSLCRLALDSVEIETALLASALRAGLPELEARKTIGSAIRARRGR